MVKTPWIIRNLFSNLTWKIPTEEKILYLTFDDGPHPTVTPFVLEQLEKYNAKASFFCVGKNVVTYPAIYSQVVNADHTIGNHTHHHLNGWMVRDQDYFNDINEARKYIDSALFRPPYGKITTFQAKHLSRSPFGFEIVMWDVLSKDYNVKLSGEDCAFNVIRNAVQGSVIVFHDSEKAFPRMQKALISTLQFFSEKGWRFEAINPENKNQDKFEV